MKVQIEHSLAQKTVEPLGLEVSELSVGKRDEELSFKSIAFQLYFDFEFHHEMSPFALPRASLVLSASPQAQSHEPWWPTTD